MCKEMEERDASLHAIRRCVEEARGGYAAAEAMAEVCGMINMACYFMSCRVMCYIPHHTVFLSS